MVLTAYLSFVFILLFLYVLSLPYFYSISSLPSLPSSFWSPFSSFRRHAWDGNKMSTSHLKRLKNKMVYAIHSLHIAPQNSLLSILRRGSGLITVSPTMKYPCQILMRFASSWLSSTLNAPQFVSQTLQPCCEDSQFHPWSLKPNMGGGYFMKISQDLFLFITWLLVKSLMRNFLGYYPVPIAQGGQLNSLIRSFISV